MIPFYPSDEFISGMALVACMLYLCASAFLIKWKPSNSTADNTLYKASYNYLVMVGHGVAMVFVLLGVLSSVNGFGLEQQFTLIYPSESFIKGGFALSTVYLAVSVVAYCSVNNPSKYHVSTRSS